MKLFTALLALFLSTRPLLSSQVSTSTYTTYTKSQPLIVCNLVSTAMQLEIGPGCDRYDSDQLQQLDIAIRQLGVFQSNNVEYILYEVRALQSDTIVFTGYTSLQK